MPVKEYLKATGIQPVGLAASAGQGDFLNFLGIAFLSGVTILCYIRIIPIFFRRRIRYTEFWRSSKSWCLCSPHPAY